MNLTELKESLEPENIKQILSEFGVYPVKEETDYFIYPTVCHNIDGGSPKMYYYFNTKMFVCYTECGDSFNIFELIQKMEALHGYRITVFDAAEKIGLGTTQQRIRTFEEILTEENAKFIKNSLSRSVAPELDYEIIDRSMLQGLDYDLNYLKPWLIEGIREDILRHFEIGYSVKDLAIAIPHKNQDGNLIGLRGRFMSPDAPNKYMPLSMNGKLLNHPLRGNLYGLYENKDNIDRLKRVVLFEGEKGVLHFGSYFGQENNTALATCGNKLTNEQANLLIGRGIEEVIIAFDQDFQTPYERDNLIERYIEIGSKLTPYFKVSILIDWDDLLGFKDSPIDGGPEIFNKLFKNRFYI